MESISVNGKTLDLDENGFLTNPAEWDHNVAAYFAAIEGINMTEHHWEVVNFLRTYYQQYGKAPLIKILAKEIGNKYGPRTGNTKYLYQLYPCGPAVQACKIAGLPAATGCV